MTDAVLNAADVTPRAEPRWRAIGRNVFPFLIVGAIWETVARAGLFPARLFPSLEAIAAAFWRLTLNGILPHHALDTLLRLGAGFALAAVAGTVPSISSISVCAHCCRTAFAGAYSGEFHHARAWATVGNSSTTSRAGCHEPSSTSLEPPRTM